MNKVFRGVVRGGVAVGLMLAGTLHAATNQWTNAGGDNEWTNAANWSLGLPNASANVLIGNFSGANSILIDGAGQTCSTVTFTNSGGFTIQPVTTFSIAGGSISVLCSNQSVPYICPVPYAATFAFVVAPGSTLWASGFTFQYYATVSIRGGGMFRYTQDWHSYPATYGIADNSTVDFAGDVSSTFPVAGLSGAGTIGMQLTTNRNIISILSGLYNFTSFTGTVVMGNASGTAPVQLAFNGTNILGMNAVVYTNASIAQFYPNFWPLFFTNSTFSGNGKIVALAANNGYGPDVTNVYAGCSFLPGTNSTSSGILNYIGSLAFGKSGVSNTVLRIKVTGTNGVAGIDHDKLALAGGIGSTADYVVSLSDPVNRLADCNLVVDLASLPQGVTLTGKTNTILSANSDFTASSFASVQFINGTGTVNYLNQKITLTGVSTVPPLPHGTCVTIY